MKYWAFCIVIMLCVNAHTASAHEASTTHDELILQVAALNQFITKFTPQTYTPETHAVQTARINEGVAWLITSQEETGHFAYEFAPYEDDYLSGDNIVRQAGALFALGEVAVRSTTQSDTLKSAMDTSIAYFADVSKEDTLGDHTFQCVTSGGASKKCILGATSLALIGVLDYVRAYPDTREQYDDLIRAYTDYILAMNLTDAGFQDIYYIDSGKRSTKESSFSNGEAMLALVRSYMHTERADVKAVLDQGFAYLSAQEFDSPLYLWIMAALKDMHTLWPNEAYTAYGKRFTDWRVERTLRAKHTQKNYCAVTEGVVSAYTLLEDVLTPEEKVRLRAEIDFWNSKNGTFQIGDAHTYRVVVDDQGGVSLKRIARMHIAHGGFLTGNNELTQRIDFTQHCISAYIQTLVDIDRQPYTYE